MIAPFRHRRDGDAGILARLSQRAWIAGRDGSVAQSGGTGGSSLCPWTGATIASGGICSAFVGVPGIGTLRLFHAQGARTNLVSAMSTSANLASNTLSGVSRTLVEDGTTNFHNATSASTFALSDATAYRFTARISRASGFRDCWLAVNRSGGPQCQVHVDLSAGSLVDNSSAGGSTANRSITSIGGGWLVMFDVSATTWGGNARVQYGLRSGSSNSYAGDGTSGVTFTAVTLEAATFSGIGLAEGITRTADNIVWTPPSALSTTAGELYAFAVPYLWSANAGAANPTATNMRFVYNTAAFTIYRDNSGIDAVVYTDAGGNQVVTASALAQSSGTLKQFSLSYGTTLRLFRGETLAGTDSTGITAPWSSVTSLRLGSESAASSHLFGAVGAIYDPSPSDTTRAALARALNGRIVSVLG